MAKNEFQRFYGGKLSDEVVSEVRGLLKNESLDLTASTALFGDGSLLDSLALVELCLRLEDRAAAMGFEFDWTSEAAMSRSRSMFQTVGSLQAEFTRQASERQS